MKNANSRNLWISFVLLMSVLVTGCGGMFGDTKSHKATTDPVITDPLQPNAFNVGNEQYS